LFLGKRSVRFVRFGEFRLDLDRGRLSRGEEPVAVPPRALDTLVALVRHHDRIVGKAELLDLVWPDANVEEANLSQQVFTLRRILGDEPEQPRFIATLPRRGYRFIADVVEEVPAVNGQAPVAPLPGAVDGSNPVSPVGPPVAGVVRPAGESGRRRSPARVAMWIAGAVLCGVAAVGLLDPSSGTARPSPLPVTFDLALPPALALVEPSVAGVSPDGRLLAFVAQRDDGPPAIFVRRLDRVAVEPLPETEGASLPFWSPDSRRIGFFAGGKLRSVSVERGGAIDLCDAPDPRGGTWGASDVILFSSGSRSVLHRIQASGGAPVAATAFDASRRDISHRSPFFLPDGRRFVFLVWSGDVTRQGIYAGEIGRPEIRRIAADASPPAWVDGHLLFVHQEALVAQAFDERSLTPSGDAVTIASPVARTPNDAAWLASNGRDAVTFVRSRLEARLVWFDRSGREVVVAGDLGQYDSPVISPDGRRFLVSHRNRAAGVENFDVWLSDADGRNRARMTFDPAVDTEPSWSADGQEMAFRSNRSGQSDLYRRRVEGSAPDVLLFASPHRKDLSDWSRDGTRVAFVEQGPQDDCDLWVVPAADTGPPAPLVTRPGCQRAARFSWDGRYVAYESNENGRFEVFVQEAAAPSGRRWRVGPGGQPAWRADGRELFFLDEGHLTSVDVAVRDGEMRLSAPHRLFRVHTGGTLRNTFDVTPDGQRFLVVVPLPSPDPPAMTVLLNWRG
jgi:Tol biopolymer transport system component/DNA-binding winged helix-turn-helix (wHTH) protein